MPRRGVNSDMSLPDLLADRLDDEEAVAEVSLGGDDRLVVSPSRTLVYRADGLLSDESVTAYPHDAERISVNSGRRKATISLDYGLDGEESLSVPDGVVDDVLHPVLAGVLNAAGVTDPGETVTRTFRFSELTLVITSERIVKHVGRATWDEEYEEFPYGSVRDLAFEEGEVATSVVLTTPDRQERFKTPNDAARAVREALTDAVLSFYDVDSLSALRTAATESEGDGEAASEADSDDEFGSGPDPLSADPDEVDDVENATADASGEAEAFQPAEPTAPSEADDPALDGHTASDGDEVAELRATVEELREEVRDQRRELERQADLVERLIEELRRGR